MSRIGRLPVEIPAGVQCRVEGGYFIAKGAKGEHSEKIPPDMEVQVEDKRVTVQRPTDQKRHKALHGMSRTLIQNAVKGVSVGFSKKLEIRGVGYKADVRGKNLVITIGFSHPVEFPIPEGIDIKTESPTIIVVSGVDRQRVGQTAAEIRAVRSPEPYKGKGIRYQDEYVRQKAGKTAGK
jgi:large subunit ribosomal protein L6